MLSILLNKPFLKKPQKAIFVYTSGGVSGLEVSEDLLWKIMCQPYFTPPRNLNFPR